MTFFPVQRVGCREASVEAREFGTSAAAGGKWVIHWYVWVNGMVFKADWLNQESPTLQFALE